MTKILITGVAGNIGASLATALLNYSEYWVVGVDNFLTGSPNNLPLRSDQFVFIKADVNDPNEIGAIMVSNRFDYVFHYAAVVGVTRTLQNPIMVLNDIEGIKNVLTYSKNTGVKRVFFSSSSEVYGEPVEFPQNEDTTPLNSRLPYAVVKNVGESFLKSFQREYGLDFTIFRFFNTYGPRQSQDFVISKFIQSALAGLPIKVYGGGSQTRTFCYIDDNIETSILCLQHSYCVNEVVNVGSDKEISIRDLAYKIIELTNSKSPIEHLPALTEGDMTRRMPDNSRMRSILKRELISLEEGIIRTINAR